MSQYITYRNSITESRGVLLHVREITGSIFVPRPSIVTVSFRGCPQYPQENIALDNRYHHLLRCALTKLLVAAFSIVVMEDLSLS
jgi:hypothetical protein